MLKVLVVDDEKIIREGLKAFPWEKISFELVGAAEDGSEALFMVKLLTPDIVITDIKMPGMDGITLANNIKEINPDIGIIFLTGHDEIDFIKSALHLKAEEYLLKPTDFDELEKILRRFSRTYQLRKNKELELKKLNKQIEKAMPMLKSNLFSELICGRFFSEEEVENWFDLFDIKTGKYVVVTTSFPINDEKERNNIKDNWIMSMSISDICCELFSNYTQDVLYFNEYPYLHFLLIHSNETSDSDCIKAAQYSIKKIRAKIHNYVDTYLSFGISSNSNKLIDIHNLYKQASIAFNHCMFFGSDSTILFSDIETVNTVKYTMPIGKIDFFDNAVRIGDFNEVKKFLDELNNNLTQSAGYNISYIKNVIITTILQTLLMVNEKIYEDMDNMSWIKRILACSTKDQLMIYTYELIENLLNSSRNLSIAHHDNIANQIIEYIKQHYKDEISLDTLSEKFHFSTSYISRLIRKTSGSSFIKILTDIRMKEAKELLKQGIHKTTKVSEMVGYRDPSYFIQIFKKHYGITPTEFKHISLNLDFTNI